jgi:hypothetical protein
LTRSQIRELFHRRLSREPIDLALEQLVKGDKGEIKGQHTYCSNSGDIYVPYLHVSKSSPRRG